MAAYLQNGGRPVRDSDWAAKMFMVSVEQIKKQYQFAAHSTTAHNKFTDTRIGGNWAINMPPAYTRFADPRQSSLAADSVKGDQPRGMGQFYSEQIDDNAHLIHMCFGVQTFRGMVSFLVGMGSIEAALYARLGRVPLTFLIGEVAGIYTSLRFLPLLLVGTAAKFLLNRGSSKYYSMRPTMHAYWKRVDFICNSIAVNIGLYQKPDNIDWGKREFEGQMSDDNATDAATYRNLVDIAFKAAPELFKKNGGIDIYQLATRTQRLANARRKVLESYTDGKIQNETDLYNMMLQYEYKSKLVDSGESKSSLRDLLKIHETDYGNTTFPEDTWGTATTNAYRSSSTDEGTPIETAQASNVVQETNPTQSTTNSDGTVTPMTAEQVEAVSESDSNADFFSSYKRDPNDSTSIKARIGWGVKMAESIIANFNGAYEWVSFRVEPTGSISSSFSNSTKEADISSTINGFSSSLASNRFTFSNGNTGIGFIDEPIKMIKNSAMGFLSGLDVAGVINLAGSAYVDIPEHWESSSATFPSESFKMELRTPYANKLSRFIGLYVPLAMILAGALPISTGRQQYTSPFLCQVISPGRMNCKLGIIEQLSVELGVGNVGFNQRNQPLAIDVSFSVKDMNKTLHAPIDTGASLLNPLRSIFDDDNAFNDYLNTISALSMADQIIPTRRFSRNIALKLNNWDSFWSIGNWTMGAYDTSLGRGVKNMVTLGALAGIPGLSVPQLNRSLAN